MVTTYRLERFGRLGLILSWAIPVILKMVSAASLGLTLNIAQRIKKQPVDYNYTSAKVKLIQSINKVKFNSV